MMGVGPKQDNLFHRNSIRKFRNITCEDFIYLIF